MKIARCKTVDYHIKNYTFRFSRSALHGFPSKVMEELIKTARIIHVAVSVTAIFYSSSA